MKNKLEQALGLIKQNPRQVIAIVGPTGTGKTDLSLALAQSLGLPIINADSRLVFAEMNIGTAKPGEVELQSAKHYLIDIKKPNEKYSAGDYQKDFDTVMQNLDLKNQPSVIVVGGTGFYLKAALENLDMPPVTRNEVLRNELNQMSLDELVSLLNKLDPEAHLQIDCQNKIRVIRAIEIIKISGTALAESRRKNINNKYSTIYIGLNFQSRDSLYDLINKRVVSMIENGLVDETQSLINKYGITETLASTIGYKELIPYLEGKCSLEDACALIQKNTRNYAKRQITWFGSNPDINWLLWQHKVT